MPVPQKGFQLREYRASTGTNTRYVVTNAADTNIVLDIDDVFVEVENQSGIDNLLLSTNGTNGGLRGRILYPGDTAWYEHFRGTISLRSLGGNIDADVMVF